MVLPARDVASRASALAPGNSLVRVCSSALEAASDADVLVVMTPWKEFASVPLDRLATRYVLDPYGILDGERCRTLGLQYARLGS